VSARARVVKSGWFCDIREKSPSSIKRDMNLHFQGGGKSMLKLSKEKRGMIRTDERSGGTARFRHFWAVGYSFKWKLWPVSNYQLFVPPAQLPPEIVICAVRS
jgi:hypothetical protein